MFINYRNVGYRLTLTTPPSKKNWFLASMIYTQVLTDIKKTDAHTAHVFFYISRLIRTTLRSKCCIYGICGFVCAFNRNKYSITQYMYTLKSKLYRSLLHLILINEYISKNICMTYSWPISSSWPFGR